MAFSKFYKLIAAALVLATTLSTTQAQEVRPLLVNGVPATIQGIGLGDGPEHCQGKVELEEFGLTIGNMYMPETLLQSCQIGKREDYINITLDSSGSKVVQVVRHLFIDRNKVDPHEFFASLERFYGPADFSDYPNRVVAYGDFQQRNRHAELADYGVGMVVVGATCVWSVECPAAFDNNYIRVTFRMSDRDAFMRAMDEGKLAFKTRKARNADAISF